MTKWLPALIGLAVLAGCIFGAMTWVRSTLQQNLTTEVTSFTFRATSMTAGRVDVGIRVTNGTGMKGTFEGLAGQVRVADRPIDWTMTGLVAGDIVGAGEAKDIVVSVDLKASDVIGTAAAGILTGRVESSFEGMLTVSALGLSVYVPISDSRALRLWER